MPATKECEAGEIVALQRHPLDDVDDGAVRVDDHEVPLSELDGQLDDDLEPERVGASGDGRRIVDLERDQDSARSVTRPRRHGLVPGPNERDNGRPPTPSSAYQP